jgi:cytochrome c biogenesis protein
MAISTTGIQLQRGPLWLRETVELISSMRFSISLLTLIAIASIIGTVVKQSEPAINYVNQFGSYWAEIFQQVGITSIYNAPWFIVIMAFLVLSTSLCVIRNAPRMLVDMKDFKEKAADRSFAAYAHKGDAALAAPAEQVQAGMARLLTGHGYTAKTIRRDDGSMRYAAKKGVVNRWGYIFAHLAIVMICIGGLLDSAMPLHLLAWLGGKEPIRQNMLLAEVPASGQMGISNPSFRGNILIPEGGKASHSLLNYKDGTLVQKLPFEIELKKFIVEYYSTGQPRLFASEVLVKDDDGKTFPYRVEVNKPLIHKGVAVYQSSFDDGGSSLKITAHPLIGSRAYNFEIKGEVGGNSQLANESGVNYTVEWSGFRAINVENMKEASGNTLAATEQNEKRFKDSVASVAGSAAAKESKHFQNVGPSFSYKLRDTAGQAREYNVYMLPSTIEGQKVFLAGMRETPGEAYRYIRFPADENLELTEYMRLRAAFNDAALRAIAAQRFAEKAAPNSADDAVRTQLRQSAQRGLDIFAGSGGVHTAQAQGGYTAIAQFISGNVKQDEQQRAADVVIKVVSGAAFELWNLARERANLPAEPNTEASSAFLQQALNAYSDTFFFGAPVLLALKDFTQVQASVFQTARAPGTNLVYLGSLFLVLGTFAMFYIRERRLWAVVEPDGKGGSTVRFAMQARKRTLDFEDEFAKLKTEVARL